MSGFKGFLKPSEAADLLKISVKTLRHYEQRGLISPVRTEAGWRMYGPEDVDCVREVLRLRAMGLPLAQIEQVLGSDEAGYNAVLAAQQVELEQEARKLGATIERVRRRRGELAGAVGAGDASGGSVSFALPWPWGGELFVLEHIKPLTFITGPLGCGKTRFARALAQNLPGAAFLGLDRLEEGQDSELPLEAEVQRALDLLIAQGAKNSPALAALLIALNRAGSSALVVDMVEQGLDECTQRAFIASLRQRSAGAHPVFLMTRSNVILDMAAVGPEETIILCPANHSPPLHVAPYSGARGYEAVETCLASPEVRARSAGVSPSPTQFPSF